MTQPPSPRPDRPGTKSTLDSPVPPPQDYGPAGAAQRSRTSALSVTALVLAVVSLLLCWVPIVNNLIFFSGVLALILGFIAWLRSRRGSVGGKTLAVVSMLVAVLSIVGVFATQALYSSILEDVGESLSGAAEGETELSEASIEQFGDDAIPLSEAASVGPYTVSVTEVDLDADDLISAENQFNDEPDGRYVLATVEVTYTGDDEGDPWLDLSVDLAGSDSRNYSTTTCSAVSPDSVSNLPTLRTGGEAEFKACFDVPVEALEDPMIVVEESFSFRDSRAVWRTN